MIIITIIIIIIIVVPVRGYQKSSFSDVPMGEVSLYIPPPLYHLAPQN